MNKDPIPHLFELYGFLRHTKRSSLKKYIYDCGTGGGDPGLAMVARNGDVKEGIEFVIKK